jgi:hypothetical protein
MSKLSQCQRARSSQGEARPCAGIRQVPPHAAGVDLGAHDIVACVPDGADPQLVRTFGTSTAELQTLAAGFVDRGSPPGAMDSTSV